MGMDFLMRLWMELSGASTEAFAEGQNLKDLYEQTEDAKKTDIAFDKAVEKAGLARDVADDLDSASYERALMHEWQGFLNGWRLCAMLQSETLGERK